MKKQTLKIFLFLVMFFAVPGFAKANAWLTEDFSTYSSTSNFKTNPRRIYTSLIEPNGGESNNIDLVTLEQTGGAGNLGQSLKYTFPDRSLQTQLVNNKPVYCSDYSIGVNLSLPVAVQEVWVEVVAKFSSNFKTLAPVLTLPDQSTLNCVGQAYSGADYKFIFLRTTGIAGRFNLLAGTGGNGWTFGYPGNTEGPNSDTSPYYGNRPLPFSITGNPFDGEYHNYKIHARVGTNGMAEWWLDGVRQPSFPSLDLSGATSIYGIALGRNLNQGPAEIQTINWGSVRAWNVNPGQDWSPIVFEQIAPAAPSGLSVQ